MKYASCSVYQYYKPFAPEMSPFPKLFLYYGSSLGQQVSNMSYAHSDKTHKLKFAF